LSLIQKIKTLMALGPLNLMRVGLYRLGLKLGVHPVLKIASEKPSGPYFFKVRSYPPKDCIGRRQWVDAKWMAFGCDLEGQSEIPKWNCSAYSQMSCIAPNVPWWEVSLFDANVGDIKAVWEFSRFDWVIPFAQSAAKGDAQSLELLNNWIQDWVDNCPPYMGANWICGQEASLRVLHLAMAACVMDQVEESPQGLVDLIELHLKRIDPTMSYAIGQSNNHGTSEAAALFVGGVWLSMAGHSKGKYYARKGRKWLNERAISLIEEDGTFSQYSANYHRMMLDTYSFVECWGRRFDSLVLDEKCLESVGQAAKWLWFLTDPKTGDVPNLGANDGAHILKLSDCDYRDYRGAVQLACALFLNKDAYGSVGVWVQSLKWLGIEMPSEPMGARESVSFDQGGLHLIHGPRWVSFLRYPRFRFRPSQSDALHLDVWMDGKNICPDAGSFSYNVSEEDTAYFNGAQAHNTVTFDDRDQMPRIGRFLFSNWLKPNNVTTVKTDFRTWACSAGYKDHLGATHVRALAQEPFGIVCSDTVDGFSGTAVLRWRLGGSGWVQHGNSVENERVRISIDGPIESAEIRTGWESRYYLKKTPIEVFELTVSKACLLTTVIEEVKAAP
jgi:hypothetical protein